MTAADILSRAEALYELGRKRVSGRPPWAKLDPSDPYDMGMRDAAIRQAQAGEIAIDPVDAAERAFLTALAEGRQPEPYCGGDRYRGLTVEQHNAQLSAMRAMDKARQRARKAGRAVWRPSWWAITAAGHDWLDSLPIAATARREHEVAGS